MKISDRDMAIYKAIFDPVLEWLDVEVYKKNPKPGFNMEEWVFAKNANGKIVENFCIIGYLWKINDFEPTRKYGSAIIDDIIRLYDFDDEDMVFEVLDRLSAVEDKNGKSLGYDICTIKPYQAAAAIRYFLKTRKIKWKKFLDDDQLM